MSHITDILNKLRAVYFHRTACTLLYSVYSIVLRVLSCTLCTLSYSIVLRVLYCTLRVREYVVSPLPLYLLELFISLFLELIKETYFKELPVEFDVFWQR